MVNHAELPGARLSEAIGDFLGSQAPWLPILREQLKKHLGSLRIFLFGGLLRDLTLLGSSARPRDVDLVIDGNTSDEALEDLSRFVERRTRFGGLQLMIMETEIDVWPLRSTWAFQHLGLAHPTPEDLTRTTFLDVEAVIAELSLESSQSKKISDHGFFRAIANHTIDINFIENPFPILCLARSLDLADRLRFAIGPRLSQFAWDCFQSVSVKEFATAHEKAHGKARCARCLLESWRLAIETSGPGTRVALARE